MMGSPFSPTVRGPVYDRRPRTDPDPRPTLGTSATELTGSESVASTGVVEPVDELLLRRRRQCRTQLFHQCDATA